MKFTVKVVLTVGLLCLTAFAQSKPRVAVYVAGAKSNDGEIFAMLIQDALVNSGRYTLIERSAEFLSTVNREQIEQRNPSSDDSQISELGRRFNARYVFAVIVRYARGESMLNVKMINVETAVAEKSSLIIVSLDSASDMMEAAQTAVTKLLGDAPAPKGAAPAPAANTFVDPRDGTSYRTVRVGMLTWMAENLNFNADNSSCPRGDNFNCKKYGRQYTWSVAKGACPGGWRLPSRAEWEDLIQAAGGKEVAGLKLKSKTQWNGTDDYGWSALPGGHRCRDGNHASSFGDIGKEGDWWSATMQSSSLAGSYAWAWNIRSDNNSVNERGCYEYYSRSVRCVQD